MFQGLFYSIYSFNHRYFVDLLWRSQRKKLCKIGKGSYVAELPYIHGYQYIRIGDSFNIGKDIRMEAWDKYEQQVFCPSIIIGNDVTFTGRDYISCIDKVVIGDGCLFGRDVFITDNSHGDLSSEQSKIRPQKRPLSSKGPVIIGKNVWIGRQVTILSGVKVGDNSIIGANSVVNKDVPPNSIVAGCPATIIKNL